MAVSTAVSPAGLTTGEETKTMPPVVGQRLLARGPWWSRWRRRRRRMSGPLKPGPKPSASRS